MAPGFLTQVFVVQLWDYSKICSRKMDKIPLKEILEFLRIEIIKENNMVSSCQSFGPHGLLNQL